jgi:hypothetical protein
MEVRINRFILFSPFAGVLNHPTMLSCAGSGGSTITFAGDRASLASAIGAKHFLMNKR